MTFSDRLHENVNYDQGNTAMFWAMVFHKMRLFHVVRRQPKISNQELVGIFRFHLLFQATLHLLRNLLFKLF